MAILLLLGGVFLNLTTTNLLLLGQEHEVLKTEWLAKAGIFKALHDIDEGYSDYTLYSRNINFAEGNIKIGIVAISGLGVREFLIVSKSSLSKNSSISYSLASIVQIDAPSDYVIFSDGDEKWEIPGEVGNMFLGGPVHINGNLRIWVCMQRQAPSYTKFLAVIKPSDISGAVVKLKGRLIYEPLTPYSVPQNFDYSNSKVLFADGIIDYKNQMYADLKSDVQIQKKIVLGEATGVEWKSNNYYAKVTDYYPTNKISGSTPDLTEDGILSDSDHGGYEIKIPNLSKLKESVEDYIDQIWYINSLNFSNQISSGISFTNDIIAKKYLIGKGDGDSTKFYYTPKDRKIYNLYVISSDGPGWYTFSDGSPIVLPEREIDKPAAVEGASFIAENGELTLLHAGTTGRSTYLSSNNESSVYYGYEADQGQAMLQRLGEQEFWMRELSPMDWKPTKISFIDDEVEFEPSDYTIYKYSDDGGTNCTWSGCFWWAFRTNEITVSVAPASLIDIGVYKAYELPKYKFPIQIIEGGVTLSEAKYYAGGNNYYDYTGTITGTVGGVLSDAQKDTYLAGTSADNPRDYHRYWNSATNQFYVRFRVAPTNNLQIKILKWWFPEAKRGVPPISLTSTKFKIYRDPPDSTTYLYTDQWIDALKLDLSKITKYNFPKQQQYPLGFDDYNKNGKQDINEPSKYGVIYSKVPLVIGGTPEVPVTIYSEEDVYLQSINKEYSDDYENAQPVGIVTKKVVFTYHTPYTSEADLILNKVAIFTRGEKIFEFGGNTSIKANRTKLIGSLVKSKMNEKGEEDYYRSSLIAPKDRNAIYIAYRTKPEMKTIKTLYIFGEWGYWNTELVNQIRYASSFRDNPPPNLLYYIKVKSLRHVTQKSVDEFYNNFEQFIGKAKSVPSSVYSKLLMELE